MRRGGREGRVKKKDLLDEEGVKARVKRGRRGKGRVGRGVRE